VVAWLEDRKFISLSLGRPTLQIN